MQPAQADGFSIGFDWSDLERCTSGHPNVVGSPAFDLRGTPAGTVSIRLTLKDLDVPAYDHGGGTVRYGGEGSVPAGAFRYRSPCPPDGRHTYEWRADALDASGRVLATATASRQYP